MSTAPALLRLQRGDLALELAPAIGGSIASFYSERAGQRHHWLRPASAAALAAGDPSGMANFPLLPFCNRIRDGRFRFMERDIALPANAPPSPHALHGVGWQLPWTVQSHDASAAVLTLAQPAGAWPWAFAATQRLRLSARGLCLTLEVRNLDQTPMPLGLGFHPYLPQRDSARLRLSSAAMWDSDSALLPTRLLQPPVLAQLREGVAAAELLLDNNFTGWDRHARIDFAAATDAPARSLLLRASAPLDYVVIYAPPASDFFCVEPVSNCTDFPNFPPQQRADVGGSILAPGASCRVRMFLHTRWELPAV